MNFKISEQHSKPIMQTTVTNEGVLLMKISQRYLAVAVGIEKKFSEEMPS